MFNSIDFFLFLINLMVLLALFTSLFSLFINKDIEKIRLVVIALFQLLFIALFWIALNPFNGYAFSEIKTYNNNNICYPNTIYSAGWNFTGKYSIYYPTNKTIYNKYGNIFEIETYKKEETNLPK